VRERETKLTLPAVIFKRMCIYVPVHVYLKFIYLLTLSYVYSLLNLERKDLRQLWTVVDSCGHNAPGLL
jgi:hypothetical protein